MAVLEVVVSLDDCVGLIVLLVLLAEVEGKIKLRCGGYGMGRWAITVLASCLWATGMWLVIEWPN
jgi:hypothetical protein